MRKKSRSPFLLFSLACVDMMCVEMLNFSIARARGIKKFKKSKQTPKQKRERERDTD